VTEQATETEAPPGSVPPSDSARPDVDVDTAGGGGRFARVLPPALRVRTFRWYWLAQWPVLLGMWMQIVALGYFVLQVTHSQTAVGVVAAANGFPAVILPLVGGVVADRVPRRRILLVTQVILGISSGALALLAFSGYGSLASIAAAALVYGSANSIDLPTRQALIADLVDRELVVSAVALGSMAMSACRIAGPAVAGLLLASVGPGACFIALALAYVVPIAVLLTVIPDIPPVGRGSRSALQDIRAGLGAAVRVPLVRSIVVTTGALSFFGVSYMPYLPVLAQTQLQGDARVLGLLYATGGVGGLIAGLALAALGRGSSRLPMLFGGSAVYTVSLVVLSHSHALGAALPALVGISFGFLAMNTSMTTLIQTDTDPALRGRLLGIYTMTLAGLQPLGTLLYGVISRFVPLFDAIGVGALGVGLTVLLMAPGFRGAALPEAQRSTRREGGQPERQPPEAPGPG
jgi:MFS family permease